MKAGEDYLDALNSLGLYPEFLGWAIDRITEDWLLVMVTSVIEIGGPLELNRLLFRAYNLKATPQEISPFIVRVYGPKTAVAPILKTFDPSRIGQAKIHKVDPLTKLQVGDPVDIKSIGQDITDLHIESEYNYPIRDRKRSYEARSREWKKFRQNVARLAA